MLDLTSLADLGRVSLGALWLPLAIWTAVALVAEGSLRLGRASAALGLPVRGAVLGALPVAVAVPVLLSALAPTAVVEAVTGAVPQITWLPEVAVGAAPSVVPIEAPRLAWSDVALGALALAALVAGLWQTVRLVRAFAGVHAARRSLAVAGPDAASAVDRARAALGVARPVDTVQAPSGAAPFTVGWRRPVVALPPLGPEALDVAALHETAHVRRSDYAWHAAQRAVQAVFAAHPMVWVLGRGLDLDRERAADALVIGARPDSRRTYADLLLSYARLPAPALALGAAPGSSSLKSRIDAMTSPLSPTRFRRLARAGRALGVAALALVAGLAAALAPAPPADSFSWTLDRLVVDGDARAVTGSFTSLRTDRFDNLVLNASPEGTFTIADRPFRGATRAGQFEGTRLSFTAGGHRVVIDAEAPYFDAPRPAYVRLDALTEGTEGTSFAVSLDIEREWSGERVTSVTSLGEQGLRVETAPAATEADTTEVYDTVDEMPQLIGGLEGLMERVEYPELQRRAGVQGRAVVQFIVDETGAVTEPRVVSSSGNDGLDRAAVQAVQGSRFSPGRQDGEAVRVRFAVPITFRLPDGETGQRDDTPRRRLEPQRGDDGVWNVAEDQPVLIGGLAGLQGRIVYPQSARDAGIEGRVVVQFIVNEEGQVEDARAVQSPNDALSEAALEAIRGSAFEPGRVDGEPVKVRFAVPVTFRLPADGGDADDDGGSSSLQNTPSGMRWTSESGRRVDFSGSMDHVSVANFDESSGRVTVTLTMKAAAPESAASRLAERVRRGSLVRGADRVVLRQFGQTDLAVDLL